MKKYKLKRSITYLLAMIQGIIVLLLAGDCEDLKLFVISKIILLIIALINAKIIINYGGFKNEI